MCGNDVERREKLKLAAVLRFEARSFLRYTLVIVESAFLSSRQRCMKNDGNIFSILSDFYVGSM